MIELPMAKGSLIMLNIAIFTTKARNEKSTKRNPKIFAFLNFRVFVVYIFISAVADIGNYGSQAQDTAQPNKYIFNR